MKLAKKKRPINNERERALFFIVHSDTHSLRCRASLSAIFTWLTLVKDIMNDNGRNIMLITGFIASIFVSGNISGPLWLVIVSLLITLFMGAMVGLSCYKLK